MNKKAIVGIILLVVLLLGCVAAALWFIPKSTRISLSLDAVKLDETGKKIGTAKIEIQGSYLDYLFQEDRYDLVIAPFDCLTNFWFDSNSSKPGNVPTYLGDDYLIFHFSAWSASCDDMIFCSLDCTQDFACFSINAHYPEGDVYYVASASGDYTVQEIVTAFNGLVPGL